MKYLIELGRRTNILILIVALTGLSIGCSKIPDSPEYVDYASLSSSEMSQIELTFNEQITTNVSINYYNDSVVLKSSNPEVFEIVDQQASPISENKYRVDLTIVGVGIGNAVINLNGIGGTDDVYSKDIVEVEVNKRVYFKKLATRSWGRFRFSIMIDSLKRLWQINYDWGVDSFSIIDNDVKEISVGDGFACYIKEDGSLWSIGSNDNRQLKFEEGDLTHWTKTWTVNAASYVSCGKNNVAIVDTSGVLYIQGDNTYGQLGLGHREQHGWSIPLSDVKKAIAGNDCVVAQKNDGSIHAVGHHMRRISGIEPIEEYILEDDGFHSIEDYDTLVFHKIKDNVKNFDFDGYRLVYIDNDKNLYSHYGGQGYAKLIDTNVDTCHIYGSNTSSVIYTKGDKIYREYDQNISELELTSISAADEDMVIANDNKLWGYDAYSQEKRKNCLRHKLLRHIDLMISN